MQVGRSRLANEKDLAWGRKYQQTEPKKTTRGWRTEDKADIEGKPSGQTEKKYLRAKQNYLQPGLVRV